MEGQQTEYLRERHRYEAWRGRNALEENLFIWKFPLYGNQLPGWKAHRVQRIDNEGWPPAIQSIWTDPEGGPESLLSFDIYECASRVAAHEFLIEILGEYQSPMVERQEEIKVGDVTFAGDRDTEILFARANLVLQLRNAGSELRSVTELARLFDEELVRKPTDVKTKVVPEIRRFESPATALQVDVSVPLTLETIDQLERPLWYKFFSRSGEVLLEEGSLRYRSASTGSQEITVFVINENGGATSEVMRLGAR